MDGPGWDDDDLIDDYINEGPQPEEYMYPDEEEYYETVHPAPASAQVPPSSPQKLQEKQPSPSNVQIDMPDVPEHKNKLENKHDIDALKDETGPMSGTTIDLYSFERYSEYSNWRTIKTLKGEVSVEKSDDKSKIEEPVEDFRDVVKRSRVKQSISSSNASKAAPESNLLKFSNGGGRRASCHPWAKFNGGKYGGQSKLLPTRSSIADSSRPLTLLNGTRVFATKRKYFISKTFNSNKSMSTTGLHMLELPMNKLSRKAEEIERKLYSKQSVQINTDDSNDIDDTSEVGDVLKKNNSSSTERSHLWVDKHAPLIFSHLLSDEHINREVLRALRAWDPYVFKRKAPLRPTYMQRMEEEKTRHFNKEKADNNDTRPDPSERIILLSGAPGVGKTTLALIAAKHAGYRPIEVNASDERSASALKERVINAMQSKTLTGISSNDAMQGRPNCIILDEVDGADAKSAISTLADIISAEIPEKKTSKSKPYLRRPIIFICNHKYAPALRPLLPLAKIFDVNPPTPSRLVARLKTVLNAESFSCQATLLNQLVDGNGGDIRSCLHTLQFSAARVRESRVTNERFADISQALTSVLGGRDHGIKDQRSDNASVLYTVFKKVKVNPFKKAHHIIRDTERIIGVISAFDDESRTLDSLFTNVASVPYSDPTMDRCAEAHEWLSCGDMYRSHRSHAAQHDVAQVQSLQRNFIPLVAAVLHFFCRIETKPKLIFTLKDLSNCWFKSQANFVLLSKFFEGLSPKVKCNMSYMNSVQDTIPFVLWLLSAGAGEFSLIRPVSSVELLRPNELIKFQNHVHLIRSLGLTYIRDAPLDSNQAIPANMVLEPGIDTLATFDDLNIAKKHELPCVMKELLAHNANLETMKANESKTKAQLNPMGSTSQHVSNDLPAEELHESSENPNNIPDHKTSTQTTSFTNESEILSPTAPKHRKTSKAKSFLGEGAVKAKAARTARRASLVKSNQSIKKRGLSNSGSGVPMEQVIRFKYQKGFTQAVRIPCNMDQFM